MNITYPANSPATPRKADWRAQAVCKGADNDAWFPHPTNTLAVQAAKQACFTCPVMFSCAQHALTRRIDDGVWGGLTESQRATIQRKASIGALDDPGTVRRLVLETLRDEMNPTRSLRDVWNDRTYPLPDGHIGWHGDSPSFSVRGHSYTPKQLSYLLDRGHKADGPVWRACEVVECVNPRHLADGPERVQRKKQAEETARLAALAAEAAAELVAVKVAV
jgi:hypothetical protein